MFNGKKRTKKQKPARQNWKPNFLLRVLYAAWRVAFGAFKIAAGAAGTVLIALVVCAFVFAGVLGDYLQEDILPMADVDIEEYDLEQNSYMYYLDSNGQIQKYQDVFAKTSSAWVDFEDIPEDMIHAAVAIEDHRFFEHQGVDWITTIKACARMFFGDDSVGGSSITQQLIKNVLLTEDEAADDVTVQRKVLEIFRAVQLEKRYDKDEILELYLNFIYLGQGCRGIRSAAETYYGKEVEMLTAAECASIIGITNSPTWYDPYQNPENNEERKENILWAMNKYGWLTDEEYEEALDQKLVLKNGIDLADSMVQCKNKACNYRGIVSTLVATESGYNCPSCGESVPVVEDGSQDNYSWFADAVLMDVAKALAEKNHMTWNSATRDLMIQQIQKSGYHIYTTIDLDVQKQVDAIYTNLEEIPSVRGGQQLQSAIVVIDNRTGDIVAMAGGVGEKTGYLEWSRATDSKLQSGSSIKPLSVYAPGFEQGTISPASVISDLPLNYTSGAWPRNDNFKYGYSSTILSGVTRSVNAVAAHTLNTIGVNYGYEFVRDKFKLTSLVDEYVDDNGTVHSDNGFAPLAMGAQTWGVHVRDMAGAFATFPSNGVRREERTFTKVYDSDGNLVIDNTQDQEQILSEKSVNYMNYCLVNAANNGTGTEATFSGHTVAGKTGTTSEFKDRWFCGFTGYYTAAVWTGFDKPERVRPTNVNNPAAVLFKKVMKPLHEGLERKELYDAGPMKWASVCLDSGKWATDACKKDARELTRVASALVYPEDYPSGSCTKHVLVELCSGGGTPTEWCEKFKALDASEYALAKIEEPIEFEEVSYLRLTESEYNALARATGVGLDKAYLNEDYIVVGGDEMELEECPVHTQEAWEAYLKAKEEEEKKKQEEELQQQIQQQIADLFGLAG